MHENGYVKIGATKAINIDYSLLYPASSYFINVNMMIEFSS